MRPSAAPTSIAGAIDALVADARGCGSSRRSETPDARIRRRVPVPPFFYAEIGVANRIAADQAPEDDRLGAFQTLDWETALDWVDRRSPYALASRQRDAVRVALTQKVAVLTGGPGTGKTTTVRAVLQLLDAKGSTVRLARPLAGQPSGWPRPPAREAKTIHRSARVQAAGGPPLLRGEDNPIDADLVVVDEISMIDLILMNDLTKAIAPGQPPAAGR